MLWCSIFLISKPRFGECRREGGAVRGRQGPGAGVGAGRSCGMCLLIFRKIEQVKMGSRGVRVLSVRILSASQPWRDWLWCGD